MFELGYFNGSGSGMGWPPEVVGDLSVREAERFVELLRERQEAEGEAARAASKKR